MGVARWVVLACVAGVVLDAAPGPDRPDITMLYKGNSQICVAGSNTKGYGLAFMSEKLEDIVKISKFEYRDGSGETIDSSSDCDFENKRGCWGQWRSTNVELRQSGIDPISPVTDERWDNFEVYRTDGRNSALPKYDKYYIRENNLFTGISVRSAANAYILLCSGDTSNPRTDACYWIIINGLTNAFDMTGIRKCVKGVPDKWATDNDSKCKLLRTNVTTPHLIDESKWTHFMLSREDGDRIRLWQWELDGSFNHLLDYTDTDPLPISKMYFRSYNAIADWKVHQYQFANILRKQGLFRLRSGLRFAFSTSICVSLYVTMCSQCKMEISLETEDAIVVMQTSVEGDSKGQFMTWENVRMQGISISSNQYHLFATLSTTAEEDDYTFWAIDNFRKCSNNEFRMASVNSNENLLCQSLNQPGWKFNQYNQIQTNEPPICSDGRFIGQHCNISCGTISNYGCNGKKICMSVQDGSNKGACTCAAGYKWGSSGCTQICNFGDYGYDCKNKCGRCKNGVSCYINTGECPAGCENEYLPPYCRTTFPRLVSPPTVVQEFHTKIDVQFKDVSVTGNEEILQSIQLECRIANRYYDWFNCSKQINPRSGQEVTITGLDKETSYLIRAVVYTNSGYTYRNEDLPTTEATTTCEVDKELQITENSRNVTISFTITSNDSCSLENYRLELQQNGKQIKLPQYVQQDMILLDLTPYTDYEIVLTHTRYLSYSENKRFKTKQDAPGEINNLHILETTDSEVVISIEKPAETNGIIRNYIVSYELVQRIDCNDKPSSQKGNISVLPSEISKVTIPSLQPYSTYLITVAAETILPGKPTQFQCNTIMTSDISEEELPHTISTSDLSARSVTIRWPMNCAKQRGPLYFHIVLKCVKDGWCDQIPDIVLDNAISLNGGSTTHDLTPFTHYSVELRAKRSQSGGLTTFSRTTEVYTPAGSPPAVRNSTHYSKNKISISLRWLDPYPPHGHLEKYEIKHCYNTNRGCITTEITTDQLTPCDLWNEHFTCYTLKDLYSDTQYTISIWAKNVESLLLGSVSSLKVLTAEDTPSAPLNLTHQWQSNEVNFYWNHPDITNGQLRRFVITLNQTGTELKNQDGEPFYTYKYPISEEMKTYTYPINKTYRYSSSYTVTVCGVNSYYGKNATLHIDTPPETPELTADVTVDEEQATNTTVTIKIPSVKNNTKSKTSFLYVVVGKKGSRISKRQALDENLLKQGILKHSNVPNSWIAIERELNEDNLIVVLGDDQRKYSNNLNESIHNRELEPYSEYEVTVVLINLYRNVKSYKAYPQNVQTAATEIPLSAGLYALLLLLLLPVVGYFVYRYVFKKETRRASMMTMIPGLRVRTEDQHDPDVIPLTEASNEPPQSKPKKPATVPKPGPSTKPSESTAPAEVNTTGTTFFHSRIVLLENLENYLKEALENGDLDEQHALFPRGQTKPWDYGMLKPNKFKNRYSNLIAYDKNRVKLEKINNDQYSDYINASYIHGYRQDKAYIATQGPKLATVNDFWRMVWQEKTQYIVMLANVVEAGKKKCEKYWPDIDSSREYGFVDVYFKKSEVYADYEYRTFELTCKGEKRIVIQLHFTSWPDHGVPLYPQSLVPFLKKMLTIPQSTAPVVVHCSAGVGRTGTIILCDICLRMAAREKSIDALRYLHEIREQRANMVDNIDQYKLVHMVLLECLLAPDTNIPCNADLSNSIKKLIEEGGLQIQMNYLQQSSWQDKALNFASTKQPNPANESKNRFNDILPLENQVYISRYPVDDENADYINAVPVDGFRFKEQFIVTQTPMPNTVKDFWRMVAEKSAKIIVCLNDIPRDDKTSCVFWPSEYEEMKPVPNINLKYHKLQSYDYYDIHRIVLDDKSANVSSMIQVVQFKNWNHESKLPKSEENLVMLWEETENLSHGNYPMVVTCYDGATASGIFVAMSFVIEKIKLEQQCDPCLAVRVVRRNRKQFVSNKMQFKFLYRSAVIYLSMFETYSNFQPVVNKIK